MTQTISCNVTLKDTMHFDAQSRTHSWSMDASPEAGGQDVGPTPKELMLAAIAGCTAMDVITIIRKSRVAFDSFEISAKAETVETHPRIFSQIEVEYKFRGKSVDREKVIQAIELSMTKYCGVSAMVAKTVRIITRLTINGSEEYMGKADFNL